MFSGWQPGWSTESHQRLSICEFNWGTVTQKLQAQRQSVFQRFLLIWQPQGNYFLLPYSIKAKRGYRRLSQHIELLRKFDLRVIERRNHIIQNGKVSTTNRKCWIIFNWGTWSVVYVSTQKLLKHWLSSCQTCSILNSFRKIYIFLGILFYALLEKKFWQIKLFLSVMPAKAL